jgi:hypothetical protein
VILPSTGEIGFEDGLRITAHAYVARLSRSLIEERISARALPVPGWEQHRLGEHLSSHGRFEVEVVCGPERRVEGVFLKHLHPFYEPDTPEDRERRVFHEGIIATELKGQREFEWGHVFCRLDARENRDWLVVIYTPFAGVPLHEREIYRVLMAHEPTP